METGFQNVQLCSTILNVTFAPEVIGPLFFFPLLYMIFQLAEGLLIIAVFRCYEKIKPSEGKYSIIPFQVLFPVRDQRLTFFSSLFGWGFHS